MPTDYRRATDFLKQALGSRSAGDLERLRPRTGAMPPKVPGASAVTTEAIDERWALNAMPKAARGELADARTIEQRDACARSIENFIGTVKVPVGLAGPLRVNGLHAHGDYYVPLATTEAALVASYSRGAQVVSEGVCAALLLNEGVSRAPGFAFARSAMRRISPPGPHRRSTGSSPSPTARPRYGRLLDMGLEVEGNHVYLEFVFTTGDASGQNMVTIATEAICRDIVEHAPVRPRYWFVEANLSGDKKATTHLVHVGAREEGRREVVIPAALLTERLHTTAAAMIDYWRMSALGGVMSGKHRGGPLRQRAGGALHRLRAGRGLRRRSGGRRHPLRTNRRWRALCLGHAAERDRRDRRRRHAASEPARVPEMGLAGADCARALRS